MDGQERERLPYPLVRMACSTSSASWRKLRASTKALSRMWKTVRDLVVKAGEKLIKKKLFSG